MPSVLVLNGPNLNLLGQREPSIYGTDTLADMEARLTESARQLGLTTEFFQSNAEHELIGRIHAAFHASTDFIIINPGAYTHTSIAIRDALLGTQIPFIEVHLSNVHAREPFRRHSYLADIAQGVISGFGVQGYEFALAAAAQRVTKGL